MRGCRIDPSLLRRVAALGMVPVILGGCSSGPDGAAYATARALLRPNEGVDQAVLNPRLQYLRVRTHGKAVLLVLGYTDADERGRPVQVWYSADGEVVRLQEGRLAGAVGVPVEWHAVRFDAALPRWADALRGPVQFSRSRDVMPAYVIGLHEQVTVRPMSAPWRADLERLAPDQLQWFEEVVSDASLPPARYAMRRGDSRPLYGEQCLDSSFCMSWQTWPPPAPAASAGSPNTGE